MGPDITRHVVTVEGRWGTRQVHYRRAGQGPAVLLLHQSPQSSRDLLPLLRAWAIHFTLIAPDTPGYGQSDPLGPATLQMEEIAAATGEFADAIGLRRFGVYGYHTGASIGLVLAARLRGRVSALAAHGLVQLTEPERHDILAHYLPPFEPRWDGGHLAWLWARMREQTLFYPWYRRSAATRMSHDVPSPERLQEWLLDCMRAGDRYGIAYRAAFESDPATVLPGLGVPLLVTAADADPLQTHLGRLRDLPHGTELAPVPNHAEALERSLHHLLAHRGDPPGAPPATRPVAGRLWRRMVRTDGGDTSVLANFEGSGEPLLVLHDAGGSSETVRRMAEPLVGVRPLVLPDLPGHGESAPARQVSGPTVREAAGAVHRVQNELGLNRTVLAGIGAGACVALEIARDAVHARNALALVDLPRLPPALATALRERGLPSLAPRWHGGHLLEAWHMLHDARLFFPWFERIRTAALAVGPELEPLRLQLELVELLKAEGAWQNLGSDALDYASGSALSSVPAALLASVPGSGWEPHVRAAAALTAGLRFVPLPSDPGHWLATLLAS